MFKLIKASITKSVEGKESETYFRYLTQHKATGHKVWVHITSSIYHAQCRALADVWSPAELKWNEVARLMPSEMETPPGLHFKSNGTMEIHYEADYDELLRFVDIILS